MTVEGSGAGAFLSADVDVVAFGRSYIRVQLQHVSGTRYDFVVDENHAQALVLALQAAVAEVQARAVSR